MDSKIKKENILRLTEYCNQLYVKPQLKYLFFELTNKCNLCCKHCGSRCDYKHNDSLEFSAIRDTLFKVAEKYDPSNILICLTGGEPMLYNEIYKVIALARMMNFKVGMTTNATTINVAAAKALAEAELNTIAVSIDGLEETHDRCRCFKGAFAKAVKGCKFLQRFGFDVQITTVVNKENLHELDKMYAYLKAMKITSWVITNVDPIGRAKDKAGLLLNGSELRTMLDFIRNKRFDKECDMEVTYGCAHYAGLEYEREIRDFYFQCGAGVQVASVGANGEIRACLDIERRDDIIQGNIYEDDFCDVWENRFQVFRKNRCEISKECIKCSEKEYCRGDSAHTWDYDNNEPDYCVFKMLK